MKAVYQTKYGNSDVLQFGDQPTPELKPHQVRVANHATSVNPRDWMIRGGRYQLQFLVPSFPLVLGSDLAGEVIEVGKSVHNFKVGDRVFGMKNPTEGLATYAEQVAVSESNIAHIPEGLSFLDAASVPLCGLTAWQALVDKAHVQTGNKVLIIGASGGVGSFAVQIAKALVTEVTEDCSGDNTKLAEALWASKTIDYQQQYVLMGSDTYDVVFDTIGRHSFAKCDKVLNAGGRYVSTIPSPKNLKAMVLTQLKVKLLRSTKTCSVVTVSYTHLTLPTKA